MSKALEIGSGGLEFAKDYWHNVILTECETGVLAESLPFEDSSFEVIIAKDVLHHIKNIPLAFQEFNRVLTDDGIIVASEPSWSLLGKFVYKYLHEEDWIVGSKFVIDSKDPWASNQALIYNLTKLTEDSQRQVLSGFELEVYNSTYSISYLLSGGVHSKTRIPDGLLLRIHKSSLAKKSRENLVKILSMNRIVLFRRGKRK
jgi:ubiquinone/menaquinone biosynthesis C-methylase UbiE